MRVAMYTRYPRDGRPRGGVESVALALCESMAARADVRLEVVTVERGLRTPERQESAGYTVYRLPAGAGPQMADILVGGGRRRLRSFLCRLAPDIVHLHETYGLTLGRIGVPTVFTIHGFDHANVIAERGRAAWMRSLLWRAVERWGLRRQSHIISITPYVRRRLRGITSATLIDIENPIDAACFAVRREPVRGRLFFAGWLSRRKNPLVLVKALAAVVERCPQAHLHLAGEAPDPSYLRLLCATAAEQGVERRVRLLGRVGREGIREQLAEAEVFLLPSLQENAPMAISEALAAGVPVIGADRCGIPHMVEEGRTGFLVEPNDAAGIGERVCLLLGDRELNRAMGEAGRGAAMRRFHPDRVAERTVRAYEAVIAQTHGAGSGARHEGGRR